MPETNGYVYLILKYRSFPDLNSEELRTRLQLTRFDGSGRSQCLEGTRTTVLADIDSWFKDDKGPMIYWLYGPAGSGKSTIATTIATDAKNKGNLGSYQFCRRNEIHIGMVLHTLAIDVANVDATVAQAVLSSNKSIDIMSFPANEQFQDLLFKPLQKSMADVPSTFLFIIDALDECTGGVQLSSMLKELANLPNISKKLRFLVTSRPEGDLSRTLSGSNVRTNELVLNSKEALDDVQAYITKELPEALSGQKLDKSFGSEANVVDRLSRGSGGLFIHASTQLRFIKESPLKSNALQKLLEGSAFKGLDGLYDVSLTSSLRSWEACKTEFSRLIGIMLLHAPESRPLQPTLIDGIAGYANNSCSILFSNIKSVLKLDDDGHLTFHHLSFPEYVTRPDRKGKPWYVDIGEEKSFLAYRCVDALRKELPGLGSTPARDYLRYFALNWDHHVSAVPYRYDIGFALHEVLTKNLTGWLKLCAFKGSMVKLRAASLVRRAMDWLKVFLDSSFPFRATRKRKRKTDSSL
jgi:RecA/RadA recombinase